MEFHQSGSVSALIPVFYKIDPSDVKIKTLNRGESLSSALCQLVDIPGSHYSENWKTDAELIAKIADDIWDFWIGSKSVDFCGLVGMDRHMKAMYKLLDLERKGKVRWIQILGKKGIGKTELAKHLYEEISHHFDIHVWLDRHKIATDYDITSAILSNLEEKISRKSLNSADEYKGRSFFDKKKKKYKGRVLLVLNNLDGSELISRRYFEFLSPGSIVIITTQNLDCELWSTGNSQEILSYKVIGLEFPQALQLFSLHAFGQTHPSLGFDELSCRAVKLTDGNPLTTKNLGFRLSGKSKDKWEAKLTTYKSSDYSSIDFSKSGLFKSGSVIGSDLSQSSSTHYSDDLVGMDRHMQAVSGLIGLGSNKEVRIIGISGTGGIGKTTLARFAFEEISCQFHTHVFLENAEVHSSMTSLEDQFLGKVIQKEAYAIRNSKDGLRITKSGLRNQKVLVIVDGVDNSKELKEVQQMASWFHPGSRVILTTRDESLLLDNGVKHVYEVKCLRFDEALQLFYQFAFQQKSPSYYFTQLSVRAIKLVGYLPLALKVTGLMLYGKDEKYWETYITDF